MVRNEIVSAVLALENIHLKRFLITVKDLKIILAVLLVPKRQKLLMLTAGRCVLRSIPVLFQEDSNSIWIFPFSSFK